MLQKVIDTQITTSMPVLPLGFVYQLILYANFQNFALSGATFLSLKYASNADEECIIVMNNKLLLCVLFFYTKGTCWSSRIGFVVHEQTSISGHRKQGYL